jgi:hypothetical protein
MAMKTASRDFISYPTNRVVGTIGDDEKAKEVISAFAPGRFERDTSTSCTMRRNLNRLDPTGTAHGFLAQFQRTLISCP